MATRRRPGQPGWRGTPEQSLGGYPPRGGGYSRKTEVTPVQSPGIGHNRPPSPIEPSVKPIKHTAHRSKEYPNAYNYRGWEIEKISEGYVRWQMTPPGSTHASDAANTLREAKNNIDRWIAEDELPDSQKKGGGSVMMRNPYDYQPRAI